jgi:glycerate 2-kinase
MLHAAVEAIDPFRLVVAALRAGAIDPVRAPSVNIVAAGKAAWPMATAFARHVHVRVGFGIVAGPRVARENLPACLDWYDAAHPLPDDASQRAGRRALALARGDRASALVVLLSGGASAMLAAPADGITLEDKARATQGLLRAGLSIDALNCVRKHLSAIKGGQLAASAAESVTLAISDVHGPVPDDAAVIGSGPTVADPSTYADAIAVLDRVHQEGAADISAVVRRRLDRGARGEIEETPKPGDPRLARSTYQVIGNRHTAMDGAAAAARSLGYEVHVLADPTSGEASLAGERFARTAARKCHVAGSPVCVIAAGETTVRVRGSGHGGRNLEFALGMAGPLEELGAGGITAAAASAGTDGIDGPTNAAGAVVDWSTLGRAARAGLDPAGALARNDTYPFFERLDDLIVWGPTGTNVGDLHVFVRGKG